MARMKRLRGRIWLAAAALALALQGVTAEARGIKAPWEPLPADARLVTDPAVLTALFADHTVHGVYLPEGTRWREYTAANGRTIWEFDGCLFPGTWRVSGSAICYAYPNWDGGRPQCFVVYQSPHLTHFVWLDPDTGEQVLVSNALDLAAGNPDHLPLDGAPTCGAPAA
jgi:hypothetical protein